KRDGIWRAISDRRAAEFDHFLTQYQTVRIDEGWWSNEPDYYRNLPHVKSGDPQSEIWSLRAYSFEMLARSVVEPMERELQRKLYIADLGAGNGWLSNRLAERGHACLAVDIHTGS